MDSKRSKIIIEEIQLWKNSRMLPKEYCDYLLALYTKGDQMSEDVIGQEKQFLTVQQLLNSLFLVILVPLSFIVIYITQLSPIMQIVILTLFVCYSLVHMLLNQKQMNIIFTLALFVTLLTILLLTVFLGQVYFKNHIIIIQMLGVLQFLGWLIYAYKINRKDVKIISWLGFLLTIGYIFL